jgi:Kef-type K+ transport system membrane component KefB
MQARASASWSSVLLLYLVSLLAGVGCLWAITRYGQIELGGMERFTVIGQTEPLLRAMGEQLSKNFGSPLGGLILQILTILAASKLCGIAFRRLGQPQVMGEIVAGILLGPSLLRVALPDVHAYLFPESSLPRLFFLSNIGLVLFMFTIGLELDLKSLRARAKSAILVAHMSIILPFVLGAGLALLLYGEFAEHKFGFTSFALFMGVSMSLTAFPVLARILQETNLTRTPLGAAAITAAAIGDVTAWCILAVVVGIVQSGSAIGAWAVVSLAVVYTAFALLVARPVLADRLQWSAPGSNDIPKTTIAIVFMILLASCLATESIGIHALFGAFIAGSIMPETGAIKEKLADRVQDVCALILLPLFFAFTGLRTEIGLLNDVHLWLVCALVVLVAVAGKMGGSIIAARWTGLGWRESTALGALMNTRGLVELVVLNIGYDLGILPPTIFTMLVIMALATTMMTGPLLRLLGVAAIAA